MRRRVVGSPKVAAPGHVLPNWVLPGGQEEEGESTPLLGVSGRLREDVYLLRKQRGPQGHHPCGSLKWKFALKSPPPQPDALGRAHGERSSASRELLSVHVSQAAYEWVRECRGAHGSGSVGETRRHPPSNQRTKVDLGHGENGPLVDVDCFGQEAIMSYLASAP